MVERREQLKKTTNPAQIWALALGAMIGWGCFVLPDLLFLPTSGTIGTLLGIGLGAAAISLVSICCAMLINIYPVAGGTFVYTYAGLGPLAAFICGWGVVLTYVCAIAANGTALILLFRFLFPKILDFGYLYSIMDWNIYTGELIVVSIILTLFACCNYIGMNFASGIQLALSSALVIGVLAFTLGAINTDTSQIENLQPYFAEGKSTFTCIFTIFALAPFLFGGFDTIPQAAEEFNFPTSKSTYLMIVAIISGALMYGLVLVAIAIVKPYPEMLAIKSDWLVGTVATLIFGKVGGIILAIPVLAAIFSGINGFFMAASRLLFGMGRAKFLPSWFEGVHPKLRTPKNAILFIWGFVLIAPWLGRPFLSWLTDTMALSLGLSYLFACITAYRLVIQRPELISIRYAKLISVAGIITSLACLLFLSIPGSPAAIGPVSLAVCFLWIVLGIVFYKNISMEINSLTTEEMCLFLFGKTDVPLLFNTKRNNS